MKPVDSHCHLQFEQFDEDREEIIKRIEQDLKFAVLAGCSLEDNRNAEAVAEKSQSLKYCMGLHPLYHEDSGLEEVREQIEETDPSAIGEIGLDYNYITENSEHEKTIEIFRSMLEIAEKEGLNAVIHSRNAEKKCFDIVQDYDLTGFFHCFNGRPELAEEIAEEDHLIGVTAQVMHSKRVRNIVEKVQLNSIIIETDSPYLWRDGRNSPLNVEKVVREVSELKSADVDRVRSVTTKNSEQFFD